ncbi:MAG: DUF87 domain-containing protein [Acidimicrobiia bacterium]|nr:DUF87 domain-containing protein [Acidimicrobiia bacterium]
MADWYLGGMVDPATGEPTNERLDEFDADDLTTHGVIVGMTGSGKTGLGVILLEEALRSGVPTIVVDPKGDMTNLLLTFPDLAPADFRPWIDEARARRDGVDPDEAAERTADLWREGLAGWDLGGDDIERLRSGAGFHVYTPGSGAGIPLDVIGSLAAPDLDWETDAEVGADEIEGFVTGLLSLVGIEADPLASREHILLSNLLQAAWSSGEDLTLETLIGRVHRPPFRTLGVFELDTFFPEKDRLALAMQLNALVASPSFETWRSGVPLDPERLLWDDDGTPQASIVYLAHLSDDERQFVVSLLMAKLVTWMRSQPGSSELRALVYMDEVFGFVPPTAMPPAKKPILTILKQARAFGVGMVLSTQNPVDLDYKAMSNAGTWAVGRLQTERDKARILEALETASGEADVAELDRIVSGLGKRRFLLHSTRESRPVVFGTRWAMSYLRGPLTRDEVARLTADDPLRGSSDSASSSTETPRPPADDETPLAPEVADGVPVYHLHPGASWAAAVAASADGTRYEAAAAVRVRMTFDDRYADVDHDEEWEAILHPIDTDPSSAVAVDYDERDFLEAPPGGATYAVPDAPIDTKGFFDDLERSVRDHVYRNRSVKVMKNPSLKLYSRVGESPEDFLARCRAVAEDHADEDTAKLRDRFEGEIDTVRDRIERYRLDVDERRLDLETRRHEEMASGAGDLIGILLGGKRRTSGLSKAASKRSQVRKAEQRLESAESKLSAEMRDLVELEDELAEDILAIDAEWSEKAEDVEVVEIGLEKSDVSVDEVALVWIPT